MPRLPHPDDAELSVRPEDGLLVLRGPGPANGRRVLFLLSYGMAGAWRRREREAYPSQHFWGCLELARRGYEILLPEPPADGPLEARLREIEARAARLASRLGPGDVLYGRAGIGPEMDRLRRAGQLPCALVRIHHSSHPPPEPDHLDAVATLVPGATRAARAACDVPVAEVGWGVELPFYGPSPYPAAGTRIALSCGKTHRDFDVLARAFAEPPLPLRLIVPSDRTLPRLPRGVEVHSRATGDGSVGYEALRDVHYRDAAVVVLPLAPEPATSSHGLGNLMEALALARPVVVTRTPVLAEAVDVEAEGVGLFVEPGDDEGLRRAVRTLADDPARAAEMGRRGRALAERRFDMERMAAGLDALFQKL